MISSLSLMSVSLFASQSLASKSVVSTQSWRKVDFPLKIWNLFSTNQTEEVTIAPCAQGEGTIKCGVACHKNPVWGVPLWQRFRKLCDEIGK